MSVEAHSSFGIWCHRTGANFVSPNSAYSTCTLDKLRTSYRQACLIERLHHSSERTSRYFLTLVDKRSSGARSDALWNSLMPSARSRARCVTLLTSNHHYSFALPKNIVVDNSSADDDPTRVALAGVPPLWVYQIAHNRWIPSIAVPAARPSASSSASSDSSPTLVELPLCQLAEYTSTSTFPPGSACVNCSIPQRRSLQQTVWDAKLGAVYQLGGVCLVHQASNSWEADGQVEGLWMTSVGRQVLSRAVVGGTWINL